MSTHFLPVFRSNATAELDRLLKTVVSGNADAQTTLTFCLHYRIRAICALFMDGVVEEFMEDLHRSGRAFLHFLKTGDNASSVPFSKAAPWFDAITCGDRPCAEEIARVVQPVWMPDEEYEDDFQYALFLLKYFFLNADNAECQGILTRYAEILDGEPDPRYDVCQAFLDGDSAAFSTALDEMLDAYDAHYRNLAEAILPEKAATEGKLCIEGLALVNLAESKELGVAEDYLLVPSVARQKLDVTFSDEGWQHP